MAKTIEVPDGISAVVVFIDDDKEGEDRAKIKIVTADDDLAEHGLAAEAIMALAAQQADEIDDLLSEEEEEDEDDEKEVVKPS